MKRHHGALRKTHQCQRRAIKAKRLQLSVDEIVEHGSGGTGAFEQLIGAGKARVEVEPLIADGRVLAELRRVRRDKGGVGQLLAPLAPDAGKIAAVGAVTMQQHDQLLRLAAVMRRNSRPIEPLKRAHVYVPIDRSFPTKAHVIGGEYVPQPTTPISMSTTPVFRFAPSPTGFMHLGHAYSARLNYEWALRTGGRFLLRIEDIDIGRARPEWEAQIFEDLERLGLNWEEPVRRQSEHLADFFDALDRLEELDLLYPCFATRRELDVAADVAGGVADPDGVPVYPGLYRNTPEAKIRRLKEEGQPFALRLKMDRAVELVRDLLEGELTYTEMSEAGDVTRKVCRPERWGDVVLSRKDAPGSYHLAVVVDDALQEVSHVMRGHDLQAATDIHRLLQVLLELPETAFHHHRLIKLPDGRKLSKSRGDLSLKALHEAGHDLADLTAGELFEFARQILA